MPQFNKTFHLGKMNKDMDERVVPSGEYRDAMNLQVQTSDGSNQGSAQTLMGNMLVSNNLVPEGSTCIGSIASNKDDKIYYLVAGPTPNIEVNGGIEVDYDWNKSAAWKDYIIEYDIKTEKFKYVFVDIYRTNFEVVQANSSSNPLISGDIEIKTVTTNPYTHMRNGMFVEGYAADGTSYITQHMQGSTTCVPGAIDNFVKLHSIHTNFISTTITPGTWLNFSAKRILNFHKDRYITGINIIDGMLFWTDNHTEPKKIDIKRCIAGTGGYDYLPVVMPGVFNGDTDIFHTRLCVTPDKGNPLTVKLKNSNQPWFIEEENITVIRKGPLSAPALIMSTRENDRFDANGDIALTYASTNGSPIHISGPPDNAIGNSFSYTATNNFTYIKKVGDSISNVEVQDPVYWEIGDIIIFNQDQDDDVSGEAFTEHDVRASVSSLPTTLPSTGPFGFTIESIDKESIDSEQKVWHLRLEEKKPMFEFKFPRFAYRYKYEDGEYSTFSPWSEPAFIPGPFDYLPKKAYNLGMTNRLRSLKITNYVVEEALRPQDVVEIDLLYKDEASSNIYTVETIKMTDGWNEEDKFLWPDSINAIDPATGNPFVNPQDYHRGEYKVTSEVIHATVPSNQLLRQWDNVPRKALAQEITSNRLVYGNYLQNYDLTSRFNDTELKPKIVVSLSAGETTLNATNIVDDPNDASAVVVELNLNVDEEFEATGVPMPHKTCRSLRDYQIGVVYGDEYGRETPVLAGDGATGTLTIPKMHSSTANKLKVQLASNAPDWAKYFKFFVKETSNEYYNLAMDRWYNAEDGNIWLSFASADRNKVDEETFIILKKRHDSHQPVDDPARYKIIAIENSAPDFIKTNVKKLGQARADSANDGIGTSSLGFPFPDYSEIWLGNQVNFGDNIISPPSTSSSNNLESFSAMLNKGQIHLRVRTANIHSDWYQVTKYKEDAFDGYHKFTIDSVFKEDVNFATTNGSYSGRVSDLRIEFANHQVENKKEFEGRFFVKIYKDLVLLQNLLIPIEKQYKVTNAVKLGYWNMPSGGRASESGFGDIVDWESYTVNCKAELDANSASTRNVGFAINAIANNANDRVWFFNTANNGTSLGPGGGQYGCPAWKGTLDWMLRSREFFHIDACYTRSPQANNYGACTRNLEGGIRGKGVSENNLMMDIGYIHKGESYKFANSYHKAFYEQITTKGTTFRFREDPDEIVYKITGSEKGNMSGSPLNTNGSYGNLHSYHKNIDGGNYADGYGNNKIRFRIEFEELDNPGVGLGSGPSGYHITGGKNTTKLTGIRELGWWGGRNDLNTGADQWIMVPQTSGAFGTLNAYVIGGVFVAAVAVVNPFANLIALGIVTPTAPTGSQPIPFTNGGSYIPVPPLMAYYTWVLRENTLGGGGDDGSGGGKDPMHVPMPPGYIDDIGVCDYGGADPSLPYTDVDGIDQDGATAIQQARRWRQHTNKYHHIEIIEVKGDDDDEWTSTNPATWETEPKEDVGMDIYYEASSAIPLTINAATNELLAPRDSIVDRDYAPWFTPINEIKVKSWSENTVTLYNPSGGGNVVSIQSGDRVRFTRPDGAVYTATVQGAPDANGVPTPWPTIVSGQTKLTVRSWEQEAQSLALILHNDAPHNQPYTLSWFNAYSFGNGIESNRIRDDYNQSVIRNGVKASTVLAEQYKEDRRKTGLIHSGIYNSTSNVNQLNQFIAAEKITKDMNPQYGSIQKLHTRDSNIVVLHEDKIMKVLADKDALYNADGSNNVAISSKFLGSDSPFATRYGISTNPESCATDLAGRLYFADRTRGAVLRLSLDGITNISDYGMKDWFGDNLGPLTQRILGSYDDKKGEYNMTIKGLYPVSTNGDDNGGDDGNEDQCGCDIDSVSLTQDAGDTRNLENTTILRTQDNLNIGSVRYDGKDFYESEVTLSFSEKAKGWISFKSFIPESGVSINNEYYTFQDGEMYKHHSNPERNIFYDNHVESSVTLLFNDQPSTVKSFSTLNYEGSQARIKTNLDDDEYYNLKPEVKGWYVSKIDTNLQNSSYLEFKGKEDKWFTYIKGDTTTLQNLDEREFSVQGIGNYKAMTVTGDEILSTRCLTITPAIFCTPIFGCTDPNSLNYDPSATEDDDSCEYEEPCNIDPTNADGAHQINSSSVQQNTQSGSTGNTNHPFMVTINMPANTTGPYTLTPLNTTSAWDGNIAAVASNIGGTQNQQSLAVGSTATLASADLLIEIVYPGTYYLKIFEVGCQCECEWVGYFVVPESEAKPGCMNAYANNYDPSATTDDGSCTFGPNTGWRCPWNIVATFGDAGWGVQNLGQNLAQERCAHGFSQINFVPASYDVRFPDYTGYYKGIDVDGVGTTGNQACSLGNCQRRLKSWHIFRNGWVDGDEKNYWAAMGNYFGNNQVQTINSAANMGPDLWSWQDVIDTLNSLHNGGVPLFPQPLTISQTASDVHTITMALWNTGILGWATEGCAVTI